MSSFRAYLQLMRLPAVFTALADIFLGFWLNHQSWDGAGLELALLLVASGCLYLGGMVFNDVFDRGVDARERPERPIPSGRISVKSAATLGGILMLLGLGAAGSAGEQSLIVAALLAGCILAYDGWGKATVLGPILMGGCRFLNVILGASAHEQPSITWGGTWNSPQIWIALGLGTYVAGVTWFARREATQSDRKHLILALALADAGLLWLLAWVVQNTNARPNQPSLVMGFAVVVLLINRLPVLAIRDPRPRRVQAAIRVMLLSIIMLDAMLVFIHTEQMPPAVLVALLLLPATVLGRWVFVT